MHYSSAFYTDERAVGLLREGPRHINVFVVEGFREEVRHIFGTASLKPQTDEKFRGDKPAYRLVITLKENDPMTHALTDKIRPYVEAIKADAANDLHGAKAIISLYKMWEDCPSDPAAPALCEAAFDSWLKEKEDKRDD